MAHGIYTSRDFQKGETQAWHKLTLLGKPTREDFPEVLPMPLYYNGGKPMVCGNRQYMVPVAQDDMLPVAPPYCGATVGEEEEKGCDGKAEYSGTYTLFTPRQAWDWVCEVLAGTEYHVESIGMLWNRSFWFISVRLTELKNISIGDGRESKFQLNFSGGMDRSVSPQCELSNIVAVCHNTISLSRASGKVLFNERATRNFTSRLEASKGEVEKAVGMAAVFAAAMASVAKNPCKPARAERILAGHFTPAGDKKMSTRTRNTVAELANLHANGIGNHGATEFDLLNAVTQRFTHGAADAKTTMGKRFVSSEYGAAADAKATFCRLLTDSEQRATLPLVEERGEALLLAAA